MSALLMMSGGKADAHHIESLEEQLSQARSEVQHLLNQKEKLEQEV